MTTPATLQYFTTTATSTTTTTFIYTTKKENDTLILKLINEVLAVHSNHDGQEKYSQL